MSYYVFLLFTLISIISSYVAPFVNPSLLINIEGMFLYFKMTGYKKSPQTILQITSILLQYRFKANFNVTSNKLQFTLKYRSIVPKGISFHSLSYHRRCQQYRRKHQIPSRKVPKILSLCTYIFILFALLRIKFIRNQTCQRCDQRPQSADINPL